ncbi:MAG: nuclear transport factor 2 family protein [Vibrio sp.]
MDNHTLVLNALNNIIGSARHNEAAIALYFSPEYRQTVDGKHLTYISFIEHMKLLKQQTLSMSLEVVSSAENEDTVFTHHLVEILKAPSNTLIFEVFACFKVQSHKIVRCQELTRMVTGSHQDIDLGSRYQ